MSKSRQFQKQILLIITITSTVNCLPDRQGGARRINSSSSGVGNEANDYNFKSKCGNREKIAKRTSECLNPLYELIEGRFEKVPSNDNEIVATCDRFVTCEKCLRSMAKDCLNGLHKTAVGAFATSTSRFKKVECKTEPLRARYMEPMRCAKARGPEVAAVYRNMTGVAQAIRDLQATPEEKMLKVCCLLKEIDDQLTVKYNGYCPQQTQKILDIVHSVTDDAKSTLCLNPKCQGALNSVLSAKYKPPQTFIEPVMQILLTINTEQ